MHTTFFDLIALESFLGAELNFHGHSRSSETARFDRECSTSY